VFALGAIAIFAASVLSADDVYYWLSVASGALVAVLGGFLLVTRLRRIYVSRRHAAAHHDDHGHDHHDHEHVHSHDDHGHDHGHSHAPVRPGWRGLVALGVSGGLVPCPTALVVMLGAIAIGRTVYGLVLVTAFSVGLAGVLTGIGLLMVYGQHLLAGSRARSLLETRLVRGMMVVSPVLSALAILGLGLVLASRATL
jgi:ABC-type nickel/cobalt efflux system permease component RcnA